MEKYFVDLQGETDQNLEQLVAEHLPDFSATLTYASLPPRVVRGRFVV